MSVIKRMERNNDGTCAIIVSEHVGLYLLTAFYSTGDEPVEVARFEHNDTGTSIYEAKSRYQLFQLAVETAVEHVQEYEREQKHGEAILVQDESHSEHERRGRAEALISIPENVERNLQRLPERVVRHEMQVSCGWRV